MSSDMPDVADEKNSAIIVSDTAIVISAPGIPFGMLRTALDGIIVKSRKSCIAQNCSWLKTSSLMAYVKIQRVL